MKWGKFQTRECGKWILTGEHAVLRGATAIALPHSEIGLDLSFQPEGPASQVPDNNESEISTLASGFTPSMKDLSVQPPTALALIDDLLGSVIEKWESDGRSFSKPKGELRIDSTIPVGAGLGSSAALCVALTRWMAAPLALPEQRLAEFATQLEHRFHGRSSGMDVAVILSQEPISFVMGRGSTPLGIRKLPKFTFHDTGLRTRTSECVLRVETFRENLPEIALKVDESMSAASRLAMEGLVLYDSGNKRSGLNLLKTAMQRARECFYSWELVPGQANRLEDQLLREGALAVKLTGAGGGGMVVALWEE